MLKLPTTVTFDPTSIEHQAAMALLILHNKQHPTLRFELDDPSSNIPHELTRKFIQHHLQDSSIRRVEQLLTGGTSLLSKEPPSLTEFVQDVNECSKNVSY